MKKGFTLLELMVVIIILGVLATLGVMQYQSAIEKSRGAEARQVIGLIRSQCAAIYMGGGSTTNCTAGNLRIGIQVDMIPSVCRGTHFFSYSIGGLGGAACTITATRCVAGGKTPDAPVVGNLSLATDFAAGTDIWSSTGGY